MCVHVCERENTEQDDPLVELKQQIAVWLYWQVDREECFDEHPTG